MILTMLFYLATVFLTIVVYNTAKTFYKEIIHQKLVEKLIPLKCKVYGHDPGGVTNGTKRWKECKRCETVLDD